MAEVTPYLLDTKSAAKFIGFARATLDKMRNEKRGPDFVKAGSRVRYRIEDLKAWADGRVTSAAA